MISGHDKWCADLTSMKEDIVYHAQIPDDVNMDCNVHLNQDPLLGRAYSIKGKNFIYV